MSPKIILHHKIKFVFSLQSACGGILRGSGRQHLGAIVVTIGYMIALGLGISLMFLTYLRIQGNKHYATETESCPGANFVVTCGTAGCHYDNL